MPPLSLPHSLGNTGWLELGMVLPPCGRLELELGIFPPPGQLGLDRSPVAVTLVAQWLNFPSSSWRHEGIFSPIFTVEPGTAPGGTAHKVWCIPPHWAPPQKKRKKNWDKLPVGFDSQSCPHWASSRLSMQFRFSYSVTSSHGGFYLCIYAPVNCDSLYQRVCLTWGKQFSLRPQFSDGSEKSCWCCLFSFLLSGRTDGLRSSLHAGPQTEILPYFSMLFTSFVP